MKLTWHKHAEGLKSINAGDYHAHASGDNSVTTYKIRPFENLGPHDTFRQARECCEAHHAKGQHNAI
jgi:hypothetical protein